MSSIVEAYLMVSRARTKLAKEGAKPDHDLRRVVLHANLLDNLLDKIDNHKFENDSCLKAYSPYSSQAQQTVTFVEDDFDDDDDDNDASSDNSDEDYYYLATEISYSDDDTYDESSSSDESDDEEEDDDDDEDDEEDYNIDIIEVGNVKKVRVHGRKEEKKKVFLQQEKNGRYNDDDDDDDDDDDEEEEADVTWNVGLSRTSSHYRLLPTIDELSEQELDALENLTTESESETEPEPKQEEIRNVDNDSTIEEEEEEEEEEEIEEIEESDITELNKTPSLNYSSSTDDEDEDGEDHDYTSTVSSNQLFIVPKFQNSNHQGTDNIVLHPDIVSSDITRENVVCQ